MVAAKDAGIKRRLTVHQHIVIVNGRKCKKGTPKKTGELVGLTQFSRQDGCYDCRGERTRQGGVGKRQKDSERRM